MCNCVDARILDHQTMYTISTSTCIKQPTVVPSVRMRVESAGTVAPHILFLTWVACPAPAATGGSRGRVGGRRQYIWDRRPAVLFFFFDMSDMSSISIECVAVLFECVFRYRVCCAMFCRVCVLFVVPAYPFDSMFFCVGVLHRVCCAVFFVCVFRHRVCCAVLFVCVFRLCCRPVDANCFFVWACGCRPLPMHAPMHTHSSTCRKVFPVASTTCGISYSRAVVNEHSKVNVFV